MLAGVGDAGAVLDIACGGGRLTAELARQGAAVTGIDTNAARLAQAAERARAAGVDVRLVAADMDEPLPFAGAAFDAVTSRLALMIARDPVATLREAARVLRPGGAVVTAVWASVEENPWFGVPRGAVAAALGAGPAAFARAFGRLGDVAALADVHRRAGLHDVAGRVLRDEVRAPDAPAHWAHLTGTIGHYRRLAAGLEPAEAGRLAAELAERLEPFRRDGGLCLGRAMVLVTATA
jgi:SAM-dependent methyltransferase